MKSRTFPARYAILKYRKNAEDTSLSQNYSFTRNYLFYYSYNRNMAFGQTPMLCKILKQT